MAGVDMKRFIARQKASGDTSSKQWGEAAVRSMELNNLEVGDVLVFPKAYDEILSSSRANNAQYVVIPTEAGGYRSVFPGTFMKRMEICEMKNGEIIGTGKFETAKGSAVDKFQEYDLVGDAMNAFLGKKIKVTGSVERKVRGFGDNSDKLRSTRFLTLDLVE